MPNASTTPTSSVAPVPSTTAAPNVAGTSNKSMGSEPKPAGSSAAVSTPPTSTIEEMFEVVIDGKAQKKTRKEIIEAYQLRQLSDRKRSEAERVLAEYKQLQEVSKRDPIRFMKAMGYDFDGLATSYLAKKAEDAMKDPAVREVEQLKQQNEEYKKWVDEQKTNMEKATREKAIQVERERIHKDIIEAIEEKKELGFPIDENIIIEIAKDLMVYDKAKQPLNAKEALPKTYARLQTQLQGFASKMEGEALVKWLGEDVAKKIRKYDLQQLKAKRKTLESSTNSAVKSQKQDLANKPAKPYKTWSQFKAETLDKIQ